MKKNYFVSFNCKFIAGYKTMQAALNFIKRKSLKNDESNLLYIIDRNGETYDPITGEVKEME